MEHPKLDLCQVAYCATTGISKTTLQRYAATVRQLKPKGKASPGRPLFSETPAVAGARAWFKSCAAVHDYVPSASVRGQTQVRLSTCPAPSWFALVLLSLFRLPVLLIVVSWWLLLLLLLLSLLLWLSCFSLLCRVCRWGVADQPGCVTEVLSPRDLPRLLQFEGNQVHQRKVLPQALAP